MTKEGANARQATFLKRRPGLLKKASELYAFCAIEMAIIVLSPRGESFYFGHPSMDAAAQTDRDQFLEKLNKRYANVLEQMKVGIKGAKELDDIKLLRFENLSFSEFMVVDEWLEDVEKAVDKRRMDLVAPEVSSSTPCPRAIDASIRSKTDDRCDNPRKAESGNA
ncbi:hypothetical protein ACJRO7_035380 [Eucalyptus globulus]|uniref:MADS-box domain-containing protein n=1 Tax=Eucalyptus globulus TaxID=34317 RepID=A0ABD3J763_EUCGL